MPLEEHQHAVLPRDRAAGAGDANLRASGNWGEGDRPQTSAIETQNAKQIHRNHRALAQG